jgi:hypothetical protein
MRIWSHDYLDHSDGVKGLNGAQSAELTSIAGRLHFVSASLDIVNHSLKSKKNALWV